MDTIYLLSGTEYSDDLLITSFATDWEGVKQIALDSTYLSSDSDELLVTGSLESGVLELSNSAGFRDIFYVFALKQASV